MICLIAILAVIIILLIVIIITNAINYTGKIDELVRLQEIDRVQIRLLTFLDLRHSKRMKYCQLRCAGCGRLIKRKKHKWIDDKPYDRACLCKLLNNKQQEIDL